MKLLLFALAGLLCLPFGALRAQGGDSTFVVHPKPDLEVGRRAGKITIDGELNDYGWIKAAHTTEFVTALPVPNTPPKAPTEAYITYDDNYLYVAMIAHDPDPSAIRASMVGRDRIFDDDFMGLILDTYGDATKAFELYVNPRGIEGDLFWSTTNEDDSYDMIYDAASKVTDSGWQMEMRIPFRSLRFPEIARQNFHATFWRNYPRETDYKITWAPINFNIPCMFCQLGSLSGIKSVHNSGGLELLPALVTSQTATRLNDELGSRLDNENPRIKPSLNARLALGTATSVEAAIEPDFSQVESDAAQVSANAAFALFYPEHRPFFQDGSDLWNTNISAVYTRSLNSPIAAAKVLHRDGNASYAFLSSYDENTPIIIPGEDRSYYVFDPAKSFSNIFRATRTLDDDRYFGILGTDRRYAAHGSNTVYGVDGRYRLFENVVVFGQQLFSHTREQDSSSQHNTGTFDAGRHTVEFDGETFNGNANNVAIERYTPTFDVHLGYEQTSPTFRAGDGFVTKNSYRSANGFFGYKHILRDQPSWLRWLVELDGSVVVDRDWNYGGARKVDLVRPEIDVSLVGQTDLHFSYQRSYELFGGIDFKRPYQFVIRGNTRFMQGVSLSGKLAWGHSIHYDVDAPDLGTETTLSLSARFRMLDGVSIEPAYTYARLDSLDRDGSFFRGSIYYAKVGYQFSKELQLRMIGQYDGFAREFFIDPLVTYQLNPFTNFYLGSTHNFVETESNTFRATERQIFAKVQYLFQL